MSLDTDKDTWHPRNITIGHVMRRNRCGLTRANEIIEQMVKAGDVKPIHNKLTGAIMHYRDLREDAQ